MRLIDADALRSEMYEYVFPITANNIMGAADSYYRILHLLEAAPTIEAEIPKHGRWIPHNKGQNNWCECSECNTVGSPFWKRCPVCEAKMDGERKNNE